MLTIVIFPERSSLSQTNQSELLRHCSTVLEPGTWYGSEQYGSHYWIFQHDTNCHAVSIGDTKDSQLVAISTGEVSPN